MITSILIAVILPNWFHKNIWLPGLIFICWVTFCFVVNKVSYDTESIYPRVLLQGIRLRGVRRVLKATFKDKLLHITSIDFWRSQIYFLYKGSPGIIKWLSWHKLLKLCIDKMKVINACEIVKTLCSPGYHHSSFMTTHALEHIMYGLRTDVSNKIQLEIVDLVDLLFIFSSSKCVFKVSSKVSINPF